MEFQTFKDIIKTITSADKFIDEAKKVGIDLIESPLCDCYGILAAELFKIAYGEDGCDMVMEFLYKDVDKHEVSGTDEHGQFYIDTLTELWNYLEEHYKA
jgi:hypothetical protein